MKAGIFLKAQKIVVKNAPTILATMGAIGAVASTGLAIDGTLKARKELDKIAREEKGAKYFDYIAAKTMIDDGVDDTEIAKVLNIDSDDDTDIQDLIADPVLSTGDKIKLYTKCYAPTAIMLAASLVCIFGSNHISKKRIAQLAGACLMSERALKEYKAKTAEVIGSKKAKDISDGIIQDKIDKNPVSAANVDTPAMTNITDLSLWYDVISDRYFYSSAERIRRAEIEAQRMLDKNGFVSVNDVYAILGIKDIPIGNDIGWQRDMNHDVKIEIGGALDDNQQPVGTMNMEVRPSSAWFSEI